MFRSTGKNEFSVDWVYVWDILYSVLFISLHCHICDTKHARTRLLAFHTPTNNPSDSKIGTREKYYAEYNKWTGWMKQMVSLKTMNFYSYSIRHVVTCVGPSSIFHNPQYEKYAIKLTYKWSTNNFSASHPSSEREIESAKSSNRFADKRIHTQHTTHKSILCTLCCVRINIWAIQIFAHFFRSSFSLHFLFMAHHHHYTNTTARLTHSVGRPVRISSESSKFSILRMQHTNILLNKQ